MKCKEKILKVNTNTVYEYMNEGKLPYLILGSRKVRGRDLEAFINRFPEGGEETTQAAETDKKMKAVSLLQEELEHRTRIEKKAEQLICQGRYEEAVKLLNELNTVADMESLSKRDIRPVIHNGAVKEWELKGEHGQA